MDNGAKENTRRNGKLDATVTKLLQCNQMRSWLNNLYRRRMRAKLQCVHWHRYDIATRKNVCCRVTNERVTTATIGNWNESKSHGSKLSHTQWQSKKLNEHAPRRTEALIETGSTWTENNINGFERECSRILWIVKNEDVAEKINWSRIKNAIIQKR